MSERIVFRQMINFIIEQEALSSNDKVYGVNKRGNRFLYKKLRDQLEERIICLMHGRGNETERKALKIVRHWGPRKRAFDDANLVGGFKILIDAIVRSGHLKDDDPTHFKGYYFQRKSTTGFGWIEVKELAPYDELITACEKMAESMEVTPETLMRAGLESNLIKQ